MLRAEPRTPFQAKGREGQNLPWHPWNGCAAGMRGTQTGPMRRLRPRKRVRDFNCIGRKGRWGRKSAPNVRAGEEAFEFKPDTLSMRYLRIASLSSLASLLS